MKNKTKKGKRKSKFKINNKFILIELMFLIITLLFSLFGFILISYNGDIENIITGFTSFSIYPEEDLTNETFLLPIEENLTNINLTNESLIIQPIENLTIIGNETGFTIQPIENLSAQFDEEAGFTIQPIENLTLAGNETGFTIQPIAENKTYVTYNVEVFANGGRYLCESNQPYAKCIKDDGKKADYGELS